jgi:hypothetical protein
MAQHALNIATICPNIAPTETTETPNLTNLQNVTLLTHARHKRKASSNSQPIPDAGPAQAENISQIALKTKKIRSSTTLYVQ